MWEGGTPGGEMDFVTPPTPDEQPPFPLMSNLLPPLKNIHTREMIDPELRSLSEVLLEGRGVLRGEMGSAPPTP